MQQITARGGREVGGTTECKALGEELQPPVGPVLLGLAMDLHVSVAGLDFIEHSGFEGKRKEDLKIKTICWLSLKLPLV